MDRQNWQVLHVRDYKNETMKYYVEILHYKEYELQFVSRQLVFMCKILISENTKVFQTLTKSDYMKKMLFFNK